MWGICANQYVQIKLAPQSLKQLACHLAALPPDPPFCHKHGTLLLDKLNDMGILPSTSTRLRMAEPVQAATAIVELGHVRVGTETVTDTAFLVT
jgi:U3 small nucleolar ribonucleoprotein protein IMP3